MSDTHTEREEECLQCGDGGWIWCPDNPARPIECRECNVYRNWERENENRTAVTFYIPDGMSVGYAIRNAFAVNYPEKPPEMFEQWMIWNGTQEQIQEAIDNTFPQKDA